MVTYLERYIQGEYEAVWDELLALGEAVQQDPLRQDSWAVVRETMRRVRWNILETTRRLNAAGYRFGVYPLEKPKFREIPFRTTRPRQAFNESWKNLLGWMGSGLCRCPFKGSGRWWAT